jgi:hypothetical protein
VRKDAKSISKSNGSADPPGYGAAFSQDSVIYNYAGNVEGGSGIEMSTPDSIPIDYYWFLDQ